MNILVCIKQVPDTTEIRIDPVTNTLMRSGVPSIVNPYDMYALEAALGLCDQSEGIVSVLTMGPEQAAEALRSCLAAGAHKAALVSDRVFAGSDTLATSFILAEAVRFLEDSWGKFDLILCGKQAIDGDTAQVGPELAEHLKRAQVTGVSELRVQAEESLAVKREHDEGYDWIEVKLPAVVTITRLGREPRLPSIKGRMRAGRAEIEKISAEKLGINRELCGLKGSPTRVKCTFVPERRQGGILIQGTGAAEAAERTAEWMKKEHIF